MGQTLKSRLWILPVWLWALILIGVLALYLTHRKKQQQAAAQAQQAQGQGLSSNLGTVPISNLTTAAQPMPIQMGDTFVNVSQPVDPGGPAKWKHPPSWSMQPAPPPAPPPPPSIPGYGLVQTAKGLMDWLGVNKPGQNIYNVGGGAPVYFGDAEQLAQGAQYQYPGVDIYTPVQYVGQVATTPQPIAQAYTG